MGMSNPKSCAKGLGAGVVVLLGENLGCRRGEGPEMGRQRGEIGEAREVAM